MKRISITGATGALGQAVVAALKAKGITVTAAARDSATLARSAGVEAVSFDYQKSATHAAAIRARASASVPDPEYPVPVPGGRTDLAALSPATHCHPSSRSN